VRRRDVLRSILLASGTLLAAAPDTALPNV
jgi:hypothetical protein